MRQRKFSPQCWRHHDHVIVDHDNHNHNHDHNDTRTDTGKGRVGPFRTTRYEPRLLYRYKVDGKTYSAKNWVIASGSSPAIPAKNFIQLIPLNEMV